MKLVVLITTCYLIFLSQFESVSYYVSTSIGVTDTPSQNSAAPSNNLTKVLLGTRPFDEIKLCCGDIFYGQYKFNIDNIIVSSYVCKGDTTPPVFTTAFAVPAGTASSYNSYSTIDFNLSSIITTDNPSVWGFWYNGFRYLGCFYPHLFISFLAC